MAGGAHAASHVDVVVAVPGGVVRVDHARGIRAGQVPLRERRTLVRQPTLLGEHDDLAVEARFAERLGGPRRREPAADEEHPFA